MDNNKKPNYKEFTEKILETITRYSHADFSSGNPVDSGDEELDAIMTGLNMLGEELQANVISLDFLKEILSTLGDYIIVVDSYYEILFVNHAVLKNLNYREKDLMGKPSRIIFSETVFDHLQQHYNQISGKFFYAEEAIIFSSEGKRILCELSIRPIQWKLEDKSGYLCIGHPLENKNENINIAPLDDKIIESLTEGYCLISENTGKILFTNQRMEEMFGYDRGEITGKPWDMAPFPSFSSGQKDPGIAYHVAKSGFWKGENQYYKKDGSEIWCNTRITTIEQASLGTVWVIMLTDISALKFMQSLLEKQISNDPLRQNLLDLTNQALSGIRGSEKFPNQPL